jgi:ABC-type branched-subunit amino acid transport system ATPase component
VTTAYLQAIGLDHRFGGLHALQECSFDIEQGRITCLVGPNGAGKTTIFNAITGFLRPDEGHVTFRGRSLDGLRPQAIVHAGIARTFQNLRLFTELSALDNVMVALPQQFAEEPLGAIFRPLHAARSQAQRREDALRTLENVGLVDRARETVRNLSYGEQKLLTVARVLATGAELLLLDEPASGLSAGALDAVMALLRRLQSEGKTLLVVEHNTRVVQQIADEVLFLHQGHLMARGSPADIIADPALAEIYFGGAI